MKKFKVEKPKKYLQLVSVSLTNLVGIFFLHENLTHSRVVDMR